MQVIPDNIVDSLTILRIMYVKIQDIFQACIHVFVDTPCTTNSCRNNGMCEYSLSFPYYTCKCLDGSSGDKCEGNAYLVKYLFLRSYYLTFSIVSSSNCIVGLL